MPAEDTVLIVLEPQAAWPRWVEKLGDGLADAVVLAGSANETPAELALRTLQRLESLQRRGRRVALGVLAASSDPGSDEAFAARCTMARALLTHMTLLGNGKLTLSAPDVMPESARHDLLELAGTLTSQFAGTALSVAVRFDGAGLRGTGALEEPRERAVA